jgi:tryptophanyl-tRNA synthetase
MHERIDPWASEDIKDYEKVMEDFGIGSFSPFARKLPEPVTPIRRGVFGQRDFSRIAGCIRKKKRFAMMTGLMPSGKFHLGHMMLAEQMIYYQKLGAKLFVCVADVEAYNMRRASMEELRKTAVEEYLLNYIALGLKPKNCDFYFQSDRSTPYYRLMSMLGRRTTFNEMKDIYGDISPAKVVSVLFQVADILHPQLDEYCGRIPVLVPVGIDQDPHIRLTRDIASRMDEFRFIPPASTYHRFMPGLKGGKMSSSDPFSYIALTDSPEEAGKKIMKYAFSGGGNSVEEHRKKGGNVSVDVAYQYLYYMFEPDDKKLKKIKEEYESGELLTGELKGILIEKLQKFLIGHQKKREKAKKKVKLFLKKS